MLVRNRLNLLRLAVSLTVVCGFVIERGAAQSTDALVWPEFRGPSRSGIAPEGCSPPVTWSETENIAWKTAIPHFGHSSPVIAEGKLWLTTATEEGHDYYAIAVDPESGEIVLNKHLFHCNEPEPLGNAVNGYASPSPVAEPGRVYVHFGTYGTAALDAESHEVLWTREDLHCRHYRGPGSSPILFENLLILTFDGIDTRFVVALDKDSGKTVWKTERTTVFNDYDENGELIMEGDRRKAFSTPLVVDVNGRPILVSPASSAAYGYDARTGEQVWNMTISGHSTSTSPVYGHGLVYFSTGYGGTELLAINPGGQGDVTDSNVVWRHQSEQMPNMPSPLLVDDLLYTIGNKSDVTCFDAKTGEVVWEERVGGNFMASPVYADGKIYFTSSQGKTVVIKHGRTFEELAENRLDDGMLATPAFAENAIFLRTTTHLYRIEND
jgi:outer membrane protein assembly factor BamB